jgi:hypothetical protein
MKDFLQEAHVSNRQLRNYKKRLAMLKISELIIIWKTKDILWNLSSAMDFSDLLYTHPSYLENLKITDPPDVYIHTDFSRDILKRMGLSRHYYPNFKYSQDEQRQLREDIDLRKRYVRDRFPFFEFAPQMDEREYSLRKINEVIFEDKSSKGFKTRITLLSSRRVYNDLGIYQINSMKYVHFPEEGFPDFLALELKLKVESNLYVTRYLSLYYFFMENINFLREIIFQYHLNLAYIYYMNEGTSFGFNNHSTLWILRYLLYLKTKYLIFSRYNLSEVTLEDYLTNSYTQQFFDSILEKEEFLRNIPLPDINSFYLKEIYSSLNRNIIWAKPLMKGKIL